jgi:hypothetical protein
LNFLNGLHLGYSHPTIYKANSRNGIMKQKTGSDTLKV